MTARRIPFIIFFLSLLSGCDDNEPHRDLELTQVLVGTTQINLTGTVSTGLPVDRSITLVFSSPVTPSSVEESISLKAGGNTISTDMSLISQNQSVVIYPVGTLNNNTTYTIEISAQLEGEKGEKFSGKTVEFTTVAGSLVITSVKANGNEINLNQRVADVPIENLVMEVSFSLPIDPATMSANVFRVSGFATVPLTVELSDENKKVTLTAQSKLADLRKYELKISNALKGVGGESFSAFDKVFYTAADPIPDFPVISDEALLDLVQQQTFKYFWDFAHPNSGLARERNTSGDLVTSGGSGFGIMALIVGIERGFITRQQGLERLEKILDFLETADRFHGAWSHWINGNTGQVIPFSANDDGGDIVETSFLVQGLLTIRQYLDQNVTTESMLIDRINILWESVEWDWYTRDGQNVLYWHWSPGKEWMMNLPVRGYNECLITYVLAASSPTHTIDAAVYTNGWARNGLIQNGNNYYGIPLPLGEPMGGPLFFAHYSYLGLDPRNLSDTYAGYWAQNINHTMINRAYCISNPLNYVAYGESCWGLTASDNQTGYSAHSPANDRGVITPTAAISSMPYTPDESMQAMRFFYYTVGDRLWGDYGFYDAFNITEGWVADSYLAIDQGPIIIMIENYRTGLLWDLFMSCPEVQDGLMKLGFSY